MKAVTSGESLAGIPVSRKSGFIALTVALAALMLSSATAFAARRHHGAASAAPAEE